MDSKNSIHPVRVLIVEDEQDSASTLSRILNSLGMETEVSPTLYGALARLESDGIDCVVLDLTLPDAKGIRAAEVLQERFPLVPFVINTGYEDLAVKAIESGAQDAVIKPADPSSWERRILYSIARHKVRHKFEPVIESLEKALAMTGKLIESVEPGSTHFGRIEP